VMIQEVGVDLAGKCMLWVKARPDYRPLFSFLDGLRVSIRQGFWVSEQSIEVNICDMREDMGYKVTQVKIAFPMSHNILTSVEDHIEW